jgi:hypothetical protein
LRPGGHVRDVARRPGGRSESRARERDGKGTDAGLPRHGTRSPAAARPAAVGVTSRNGGGVSSMGLGWSGRAPCTRARTHRNSETNVSARLCNPIPSSQNGSALSALHMGGGGGGGDRWRGANGVHACTTGYGVLGSCMMVPTRTVPVVCHVPQSRTAPPSAFWRRSLTWSTGPDLT